MFTRKITFYKPEERMPEDGQVVLIASTVGWVMSAVYKRGRFYELNERFYYTLETDVELWASANWEDTEDG